MTTDNEIVDQDAEQLKDETDEEWVKAWKKALKVDNNG